MRDLEESCQHSHGKNKKKNKKKKKRATSSSSESEDRKSRARRKNRRSGAATYLLHVTYGLLSVVAVSGHLTGLPLGKQILSSSISVSLKSQITIIFHCSVCSGWLHCILTSINSITNVDCYSGFPLSLVLKDSKDSPFSSVFTLSGNLFQHSTDLTSLKYLWIRELNGQ
jgi:hypothetical protein